MERSNKSRTFMIPAFETVQLSIAPQYLAFEGRPSIFQIPQESWLTPVWRSD
jgi:hypothetical protein